ncbi:NeuD/PglB/VioB family sugar acetyltransferase [Aquimarina hainanensis]|uniref:NeuD/PglB/VioB family sugar acetyltransferase n=1 Tax=Aquimarina hainanensis TaxID=1578017 RepID=A0ABW5NBN1_9FLAO|nr:NeuD/PglB/VioB family sugar acetyltransferase [Aquimarina sp. TRL1]QKX06856.1 NeuD/PglB/VioB family sugar acetyltransferase [Aquimarina sp. TRL1]
MEKVLIIGASGHGKVIAEAIELEDKYEIYGFIDSYKPKGQKIMGYDILGSENIIPALMKKGITKGIISIGDNWIRYKLYKKVLEVAPDFEFITVIHPSAIVSEKTNIGRGTVILASGTVNADAVVGEFCIINTNANFGHDGIMEDFSSLAPGVTTGGTVIIGEFTAISIAVTILQNTTIGAHTVIGAGAVVTKDIRRNVVAYGIPAKKVRERENGDGYLGKSTQKLTFSCYTIDSEKALKKYKKILNSVGNENPFYTLEYIGITGMREHRLSYFVLERNSRPIVVMPFYLRDIKETDGKYKDVVSPYGYGGPLLDIEHVECKDLEYFWREVDAWYKKENIVSEFIRFSLNNNHCRYNGELIPTLTNVKGEIVDEETQWSQFKAKVRNNYRKATQQSLTLKVYSNPISPAIIKDFYDIYISTMQRNNADSLYYHKIDYFIDFIKNNPKNAIIGMVYKDDKPISTELILVNDNTLYSYLGGTLSDYFYTRPNDFLKIEVMNWARKHHYKYYILGGGRSDGDSLYKYKKSFFPNDQDVTYYTGRKIINPEQYMKLVLQKCNMTENMTCETDIKKGFFPLYRLES